MLTVYFILLLIGICIVFLNFLPYNISDIVAVYLTGFIVVAIL